jgi:hypothetical protein
MLATKVTSIVEEIPRRIRAHRLRSSEQRIRAVGLRRTARDVILGRTLEVDRTASTEGFDAR